MISTTTNGRTGTGAACGQSLYDLALSDLAKSAIQRAESAQPDPEMVQKAMRRRHTAEYKLSIISQADACRDRGEIGALLRREGLFYSTLANFRKQKAQGLLSGGDGAPRPRASKVPAVAAALAGQAELERENRKLRRQLAHAEKIIAIQKKAAILLGETLQDMSLDDLVD